MYHHVLEVVLRVGPVFEDALGGRDWTIFIFMPLAFLVLALLSRALESESHPSSCNLRCKNVCVPWLRQMGSDQMGVLCGGFLPFCGAPLMLTHAEDVDHNQLQLLLPAQTADTCQILNAGPP